ncbi:CYTH domain-containing protein [Pseudalkalibacillus caeni]|uniref:CYTH domain-containing protein n=1 Tax=Exobacillus caeni TaxID=2574798 RepID=A0A5R9FDT3_9BACL|nr:CYTH domain-containing protein [Pseudalkalibacillus caeni]TLS37795.1 CYTH domain-containing protein [Pseudalkalibacillus caeni]
MGQELEIEFKNLLTREEYKKLLLSYSVTDNEIIEQHNLYFDTPDFLLKAAGSALRVRVKNEKNTLTLKQPHKEALLETHQNITDDELENIKNGKTFPTGEVYKALKALSVDPNRVTFLGTLTTFRFEKQLSNGLLVLDRSCYLGTEDYELEFEVTDLEAGKTAFYYFLKQNQIPERKTPNKIRRFFDYKQKLNGEQ